MGRTSALAVGAVRAVLGPPKVAWFALGHSLAGAADAMVTVSLAGSLFFNLSPDASRSQILLYLTITMIPFTVLAPFVGPAIDRFQGARRAVAAVCYGLRAASCVLLAISLVELSFYVFALLLLVVSKASGVVKQSLVPALVDEPSELVAMNARLAKLATVAGLTGGAVGVALLQVVGAATVIRLAAVVFGLALLAVLQMPVSRRPDDDVPEVVEYAELHLPAVVVAAAGYTAMRAAVGFFVFVLAFGLRSSSAPAWLYGAAIVAYGTGAFAANVVAPGLRRRFREEHLMAGALIVPAVFTALGILGVSTAFIMATSAVMGAAETIARQAFDSLVQRNAPDAMHGRTFARYETRFQLAWVLGGVVATAISFPTELSMAVLTVVFVPTIVLFLRGARDALRFQSPVPDAGETSAAERRLRAAHQWLARGAERHAIVEATSAVELALLEQGQVADPPALRALDELRQQARDSACPVTLDDAEAALKLARKVIDELSSPDPPS